LDSEADTMSSPQISARMGSVNDGRFERLPRRLIRDVELLGVASGLWRRLPAAKGHASLLGVPMVVKSFSNCGDSLTGCMCKDGFSLSAEGPLQIFTLGSVLRNVSAANSAVLIECNLSFLSTSSLWLSCWFSCSMHWERGCSEPINSNS
jgi:hypothetical protein